jgi:uncharacterized protein involved in response to NO
MNTAPFFYRTAISRGRVGVDPSRRLCTRKLAWLQKNIRLGIPGCIDADQWRDGKLANNCHVVLCCVFAPIKEIQSLAIIIPVEPATRPPPGRRGFALWNLGFRPFYLLASLFAALAVPLWAARVAGAAVPSAYISDALWHGHEMLFGYTLAVVVGFLFTAVRNWTASPTPTGATLAGIAALWVAARLALPWSWHWAAVLDTLFVLAAAAGIAVPLRKSRNNRNAMFVAIVLGMGAANLALYFAVAGLIPLPAERALQIGLDLVLIVMTIIGGRVIPMFTASALRLTVTRFSWLEATSLGGVVVLLIVDGSAASAEAQGIICAIAAAAHAARLALWRPWGTWRRPILWILHLSYAWIPVHLALRALASFGAIPSGPATHALTVGAIGGLTLGMMTRTALGHTGRALQAGPVETACYVLVQLAAATRVFLPLAVPALYLAAIEASAALWSLAFLLYAFRYWPILSRPRVDGVAG